AAGRLAALDRDPERAAPEALGRAAGEGGVELPSFRLDARERPRVEVDLLPRERQLLKRERPRAHRNDSRRERATVLRRAGWDHAPADRAGVYVEVDPDQCGHAVLRWEQRERVTVPHHAGVRGRAGQLHEDDITKLWTRGRDRQPRTARRPPSGRGRRGRDPQE